MKRLSLLAIQFYRVAFSPFTMSSCRYYPTCSHFGEEAITRHGVFKGGWLTVRRLARCHPLGGRGYDPVP